MIETPNLARMLEKFVLTDFSFKILKSSFFGPFWPKMVIFHTKMAKTGQKMKILKLKSVKTIFSSILAKFGVSIIKTQGEDTF